MTRPGLRPAARWEKLGLVYCANGRPAWAVSHAMLPTPMMLDEKRIRIYVAFVNAETVGRVGFVDLDARNPLRVLRVSDSPVLDVGVPGAFDDNGVTPMCALQHGGRLWLYYTGWQLGAKVRYYMFTGLAVSDDGGERFHRHWRTPVLDRSDTEMFVRTAAHVRVDGGRLRLWYIGGDRWVDVGGKATPTYNMRHLESGHPAQWEREGRVCLDLSGDDEFGFGRPFVVKDAAGYRMWYSIRTFSKGYRLGYAESADGLDWRRMDKEVGIDVSASGWDSEMIAYACVQATEYGTYMFYNGNDYGRTGFGVAVLRS